MSVNSEIARAFLIEHLAERGNTDIKALFLGQQYSETFQAFSFEVSYSWANRPGIRTRNVKMEVLYEKDKDEFKILT